MSNVLISAENANQWRKLHPKKHWKKGYSARTLAYCWQEADGLPSSVKTVFSQWGEEPFRNLAPSR